MLVLIVTDIKFGDVYLWAFQTTTEKYDGRREATKQTGQQPQEK